VVSKNIFALPGVFAAPSWRRVPLRDRWVTFESGLRADPRCDPPFLSIVKHSQSGFRGSDIRQRTGRERGGNYLILNMSGLTVKVQSESGLGPE